LSDSILTSVKNVLGIEADYTTYDVDILMHINTVFSTLNQLGIGPVDGYMIEDAAPTWSDYLGSDLRLNSVKTYVYLRVRLLFDPPGGSYHLVNSLNQQVQELEWRLNVVREDVSWTPPPADSPPEGGDALVPGWPCI
jgi:hypothetical protein